MHLGTNDMWGGYIPLADKAGRVHQAGRPDAGEQPRHEDHRRADHPDERRRLRHLPAPTWSALNNAIPGWAAGLTTASRRSPSRTCGPASTRSRTTYDGVHPNDAGFQKMADRLVPGRSPEVLGGDPTDTAGRPRPRRSPRPAPRRRPVDTACRRWRCTATYRVVSQWTGGFQGEVTVRNDTAAATSAWTATFSFADGQQITQAWNATVTQSGRP